MFQPVPAFSADAPPPTAKLVAVAEALPQARVFAFLGGRPGEGPLAAWMVLLFAFTQASQGLGANAADTLFFLRFGVESLPLMILLSGPVVMVASLLYTGGLARVGARRWLSWVLFGFAGLLAIERLLISVDLPGIYPVVWLGGQVVILVSFTLMWNAAAAACTTRQAKRLYPLFASAGIVGGVVGNVLTGPLALLLGTENLLLVQALLLVAGGFTALTVGHRFFRDQIQEPERSAISDLRSGLDLTRRTPLLRLMTWAAVLISALFFLMVFPFAEIVTRSFPTEVEMANFLGLFSALATAATFVVSLLGVNRLFAGLGVVLTLLILPVVYVLGFATWVASFGLATAVPVRGSQWIAVNAIGSTAWSALFNVIPGRRRGEVMAFMSAVPTQLGTMAAGALLIAGSELSAAQISAIGLVLAGGLLLLVLRMRSGYSSALVDAVRDGNLEVFALPQAGPQKPLLDADTQRALTGELNAPEPGARAVAVSLLGHLGDGVEANLIVGALHDAEWRVRLAALQALFDHGYPEATGVATTMLGDSAPQVRSLAARSISRLGTNHAESLAVLLEDPDPGVRAVAATGVGGLRAQKTLERMLESDSPADQEAALRALASHPDLTGRDLIRFAGHQDRRVRAAAAAALTALPGSGPVLRSLLDDGSVIVRQASAAGLARRDDGPAILMDVLANGSVRATEAALQSLADTGQTGEGLTEWASQEVARAAHLRRHRLALATNDSSPTRKFLASLLASRQERLSRWTLLATTTPDTADKMTVVGRGLRSTDQETRAQAVEALESVGVHAVTRSLIPLLEDMGHGALPDSRTALREMSKDQDEWIRALAVRCISEELIDDLGHLQGLADADQSGLVQSAIARWEVIGVQDTQTLDTVDRVVALQRVPMFAGIDPEDLERIAILFTERRYDAGELIYAWGASGDEMLIIVEGEVTVSRPQEGSGVPIRTVRSGDYVGELSLLRGQPRSANVTAGPEGVRGLILRGAELHAILEERPEAAMAMLATLAERLGTDWNR
jgi:HEAT repeat protein